MFVYIFLRFFLLQAGIKSLGETQAEGREEKTQTTEEGERQLPEKQEEEIKLT